MEFDKEVIQFIKLASLNNLEMIMVGGAAVNFHGYQRHSADVDFWLNLTHENLDKLEKVLHELGYEFEKFPDAVLKGEQNISLKISPYQDIEIITRFNPGKSFQEAYEMAEAASLKEVKGAKYKVLNLEDLITSKAKSKRPKDLLDIKELRQINNEQNK